MKQARHDVARLYREVCARGLNVGSSGNVSARVGRGMLITPSGVRGDTVAPGRLVRMAFDGMWKGETAPSSEGMVKALKPELDKVFKPAFLGRMVIIPFHPVRDENLKQIVRLKLNKVRRRIADSHHVKLEYDDAVVDAVAARCTEVESGARNVDNILTNTLLPEISTRLLEQMATGEGIGNITVGVGDDGGLTYHVAAAPAATRARATTKGAPAAKAVSEEHAIPAA